METNLLILCFFSKVFHASAEATGKPKMSTRQVLVAAATAAASSKKCQPLD